MTEKENIREMVGKKIAECREKCLDGITQSDLAAMLGKSLRTIQKYESGEIDISLSTLIEISEILKVPLSYLVSCQTQYINLPCAVGDTVFIVENIGNGKKQEKIIVSGMIDRFIIGDLGVPLADICTGDKWYTACSYPKDYFLTMKEAQEMYLKH